MPNAFKHKGFIVEFVETHRRFKYTKTGYWIARRTMNGEAIFQGNELGHVLRSIRLGV